MRPPHASCRKFPPSHVQSEDYFRSRFSTTNGSLLFAFETRDPHDPTSPRREASLFDSPGLRARRLFLCSLFPCGGSGHAIAFEWDVLPLVGWSPQVAQAIDVEGFPPHMYFQANQDDVFRSPPSHPALGSAHD